MTQPRRQLINLDRTPYYHCISRCVRRAFLCGKDHYSGRSFNHRRRWIIDLLKILSSQFNIQIAAYAIMSNHYHLVLFVDSSENASLTNAEIISRWGAFYSIPEDLKNYVEHARADLDCDIYYRERIAELRKRLCDISWFMKILNERIARRANQEDDCKGKFWESRFKSQMILDDAALLTCMAYVDLNPIRAKVSTTLEGSNFTSVKERLSASDHAIQQWYSVNKPRKLMLFQTKSENNDGIETTLPFSEADYLSCLKNLAHYTSNKPDKLMPDSIISIFEKLDTDCEKFLKDIAHIEKNYPLRLGSYVSLIHYSNSAGIASSHGISFSRKSRIQKSKVVH